MKHYRKIIHSLRGRIQSLFRFLIRCINTLYELKICSQQNIMLNSWVEYRFGKLKQRNWGDELNIHLIEHLTKKKVFNRSDVFRPKEINYTIIGSLIPDAINAYTIIWGAGATKSDITISSRPIKVCAVRGKLTRKLLLSNGIDCPEIYGDPALLLPLICPKKKKKIYKLGLICHIDDENNPNYRKFSVKYPDEILQISLHDYGDWSRVIDQICSCEIIASSSLHGIIVADAYGIPNIWLKSHVNLYGGDFKFMDYFSGVNRQPPIPVILTEDEILDNLLMKAADYIPIKYDHQPLLQVCPFKISIPK